MVTLASIDGRTLAADIRSPAAGIAGIVERDRERARLEQERQELQALIRQSLGLPPAGTAPGGTSGAAPGGSQGTPQQPDPFVTLGAPQLGATVDQLNRQGTPQQIEQFRTISENGAKFAAEVRALPTFEEKQQRLRDEGAAIAGRGGDPTGIVNLMNLSEEELDTQLIRRETLGNEVARRLSRPQGFMSTPEQQEAFAGVAARSPQAANALLRAEEQRQAARQPARKTARDAAGRLRFIDDGQLVFEGVVMPPGAVEASEATKVFRNGTNLQVRGDGTTSVMDPSGQEVFGADRVRVLREAREDELDFQRQTTGERAAGRAAIEQSEKAFEQLESVRKSLGTLDEAIQAIDDGAGTGPLMSRLPSIRSASVRLDNIRQRLGLDIVSMATFGALSDAELQFALDSALPRNLTAPQLREWVVRKRAAQSKAAAQLEDVAMFLGDPDNTIADWLEVQREIRENPPLQTEQPPSEQAATQQFPTATNPETGETLIFKDGQWQTP